MEDYKQRAENAFNETKECKNHAEKVDPKHQDPEEEEKKNHMNSGD